MKTSHWRSQYKNDVYNFNNACYFQQAEKPEENVFLPLFDIYANFIFSSCWSVAEFDAGHLHQTKWFGRWLESSSFWTALCAVTKGAGSKQRIFCMQEPIRIITLQLSTRPDLLWWTVSFLTHTFLDESQLPPV